MTGLLVVYSNISEPEAREVRELAGMMGRMGAERQAPALLVVGGLSGGRFTGVLFTPGARHVIATDHRAELWAREYLPTLLPMQEPSSYVPPPVRMPSGRKFRAD